MLIPNPCRHPDHGCRYPTHADPAESGHDDQVLALHGPGGGTLGLPHRLVAGAVFGWLRLRSGSLVPGIAAHAVHNALALALLGG